MLYTPQEVSMKNLKIIGSGVLLLAPLLALMSYTSCVGFNSSDLYESDTYKDILTGTVTVTNSTENYIMVLVKGNVSGGGTVRGLAPNVTKTFSFEIDNSTFWEDNLFICAWRPLKNKYDNRTTTFYRNSIYVQHQPGVLSWHRSINISNL
jgi:hypothetical protein